jgi:hypothetical protein
MNVSFVRIPALFVALLASQYSVTSWAQSNNTIPATHISGTGDQVITDVLVRSDGSRYVSGYFTGSLAIGCPSGASCPRTATQEDGFVLRLDRDGQPLWDAPVFIAGPGNDRANAMVLSEDGKDLYVVGAIDGEVTLGNTTVGSEETDSTDIPGIFVLSIRELRSSTTGLTRGDIRWVAGASAGSATEALNAIDVALIENAEKPLAIIGGDFSCEVKVQLDTSLRREILSNDCNNREPFVAAVEVPGSLVTAPRFNENWVWVLDAGQTGLSGLDEALAGMTATPGGLVYGATRVNAVAARILNDLTQITSNKASPQLLVDTLSRSGATSRYENVGDGSLRAVDNPMLETGVGLASHGVSGEYPETLNRPRSGDQMLVLSDDTDANNSSDTAVALGAALDLSGMAEPRLEFYHTVRVAPNELTQCTSTGAGCVLRQVKVRTSAQTGFVGFEEIVSQGGAFVPNTTVYDTDINGTRFFRGQRSCVELFTTFDDRLNCQQSNADFTPPRAKTVIDLSAISPLTSVQLAFVLDKNGASTGTNPPQWFIDDVRIYDAANDRVVLETDFEFTGLQDGNALASDTPEDWVFIEDPSVNLTGFRLQTVLDREDRRLGINSPLDLSGAVNPVLEVCHRPGTRESSTSPDTAGGVVEVQSGSERWQRIAPVEGQGYGTLRQGVVEVDDGQGGTTAQDSGKNALAFESQLARLEHDLAGTAEHTLVRINENLVALAYFGRPNDTYIKTFIVDEERRFVRQADMLYVDNRNNYNHSLVHLGNGRLVLSFADDSSGVAGRTRRLRVLEVDPNTGIFDDTSITTTTILNGSPDRGRFGIGALAVVDADTVAFAYRTLGSDGAVKTYDINADGEATLVESYSFGTNVFFISFIPGPAKSSPTDTTRIFLLAYGEAGGEDRGVLETVQISDSGALAEPTSTSRRINHDELGLARYNALAQYSNNYFVLAHQRGTDLSGRVRVVGVTEPAGSILLSSTPAESINIDPDGTRQMRDLAVTSLDSSRVMVAGELLSSSNNSLLRVFDTVDTSIPAAVAGFNPVASLEEFGDIGEWNALERLDENTAVRAYTGPGGRGFIKLYDRSLRGDDATPAFVQPALQGNHLADSACATSVFNLAPYAAPSNAEPFRFRLRFVNSVGEVLPADPGRTAPGWHIGSLTVRDRGPDNLSGTADDTVLISTDDDDASGVNGAIFRLSDTARTEPNIATFALPSSVEPEALSSDGEASLYLAGRLNRSTNIQGTGSAGPGGFAAGLDVSNFDNTSWSWLTAGNSGRFTSLAVAGDAIIAGGAFEGTFSLPSSSVTLTSVVGRVAGVLMSLARSDGSLTLTNDSVPVPWLLGGDGRTDSLDFRLTGTGADINVSAVHSDGLGRVVIGGTAANASGANASADIGDTALTNIAGVDGFVSLATAGGQAVSGAPWVVGTPIPAPNLNGTLLPPRFYRNGIVFDALAAKLFYYQPASTGGANNASVTPLAATDEAIEIEWRIAENTGSPVRDSRTVEWPSSACLTKRAGAQLGTSCYQKHIALAPVELDATDLQFEALTLPPQSPSEATVDQVAGVFQARLADTDDFGYSVIRYANTTTAQRVFDVVKTVRASSDASFVNPSSAQIGREIKAPPSVDQQGGRSGYVLDPRAYVDPVAYNAMTRTGQIIPVNAANPTTTLRSNIDVAWYEENVRGMFWPAKAERYRPHWPGQAGDDSLIISRLDFASSCAPPAIDVHNASPSLPLDLSAYVLRIISSAEASFSGSAIDITTGSEVALAGVLAPKASLSVLPSALTTTSLCQNGIVRLVRKAETIGSTTKPAYIVDQFGQGLGASALPWSDAQASDGSLSLTRAESVCSGARNRVNTYNALADVNTFSPALEWVPAVTAPGSHSSRCNDQLIIASQAGGEVAGREFPSTLLISQYIEDGPRVPATGSNPDGTVTGQGQLIEIFNGGAQDAVLDDIGLRLVAYDSTGVEEGVTLIPLSGSLPVGDAYVVAHTENALSAQAEFDQQTVDMVIDGNDRVELVRLPYVDASSVIDVFGDNQPAGARWSSGGVSTRVTNLTRSLRSCEANTLVSGPFLPDANWEVNDLVDISGVGSHRTECIIEQVVLDASRFINWQIYFQNDPAQMGFNPNDEHALQAASAIGSGASAVYALRADFGFDKLPTPTSTEPVYASEPYVLVRFDETSARRAAGSGRFAYRLYDVDTTAPGYTEFSFDATAGQPINPPYPLSTLAACQESRVEGESTASANAPLPFYRDYTGQLWARAKTGPLGANILFWYPRRADFYFDDVRVEPVDSCIEWMANQDSSNDDPIPTNYRVSWPAQTPLLTTGETLMDAKNGLPDVRNEASVKVIYDEAREASLTPDGSGAINFNPANTLVEYFDPLQSRRLTSIVSGSVREEIVMPSTIILSHPDPLTGLQSLQANDQGYQLPFTLRSRIRYDSQNQDLIFSGFLRDFSSGAQLLPNILTDCEARHLMQFPSLAAGQQFTCDLQATRPSTQWAEIVAELVRRTRNPEQIVEYCHTLKRENGNLVCDGDPTEVGDDEILVGYQESDTPGVLKRFDQSGIPGALSAGAAASSGYVTLALNDDPLLGGEPVRMEVLRVGCLAFELDGMPFSTPYQGQVQIIESDGVFDDKLTLRHSGDFAGRVGRASFQWCVRPAGDSTPPDLLPQDAFATSCPNNWIELPSKQPEITLQGADTRGLGDNWVVARYQLEDPNNKFLCAAPPAGTALPGDPDNVFSAFAGAPGGRPNAPQAQLAQGWVKRVVERLNPFDTRVRDFHSGPTNTVANLISQLGERFEGNIPLITTADNLNALGFIEAYETVLRRALNFIYGPDAQAQSLAVQRSANDAILLISTRLLDLYTVLGNEAYADAQDPLVGISRVQIGTIATEAFSFENRLPSLLEEELVLLRGRDTSQGSVTARPVYNRIEPNFTGSTGQAAYQTAYNISDQTGPDGQPDSIIDELDALALYPQGHGDAWGHFLQALSYHYDLLRQENFDWQPRSESLLINGGPVPVDYLDERKFADIAATKARVGAEVLSLTYRSEYTEDPNGQWQGYQDGDISRQWGVSGWASRAGRGAYFDWLTANSMLPEKYQSLAINDAFLGDFCPDFPGDPVCECALNDQGNCSQAIPRSANYRVEFCALPENSATAYCQCLPKDPNAPDGELDCPLDYAPAGLQIIDRTTVTELADIAIQYTAIQSKIDEIDRGLNPLGVARDAVPFDIDPSRVDANETHFEQVAARAETALENAAKVWDFANRLNALLRFNQDDVEDLRQNAREAEVDFTNQLVEIYGTPFPDRIGGGQVYPDGYLGPDTQLFYEIDANALAGSGLGALDNGGGAIDISPGGQLTAIETAFFRAGEGNSYENPCDDLPDSADTLVQRGIQCSASLVPGTPEQVNVELTALTGPDTRLAFVNDSGVRRVSGALQEAYFDQIKSRTAYAQSLASYNALIGDLTGMISQFNETFRIQEEAIAIRRAAGQRRIGLSVTRNALNVVADQVRAVASITSQTLSASSTCFPTVVGLSNDLTSVGRCTSEIAAVATESAFEEFAATQFGVVSNQLDLAIQEVGAAAEVELQAGSDQLELLNLAGDLSGLIQREPVARLEVVGRAQDLAGVQRRIANLIAEGGRIQAARERFRRKTASATSEYRFQDIAFRQFRNDVVQKYRATFDLAARYVYLAAKAYDYETNLLSEDSRAGQAFLTDVVRHRSIGQLLNGSPIPGSNGLSDALARMQANFEVLKGQMGFNNPQVETNRFSLRRALFDIPAEGDEGYDESIHEPQWQEKLMAMRYLDINRAIDPATGQDYGAAYQRYARPFAPAGACPQPGLIIPFSSAVISGKNFFGGPLEARDSAYDASQFSTRIRGVGAWFEDYNATTLGVSETPRVYLLPIGKDVLRPADANAFETRLWDVVDQVIPVPFPIGDNDIAQADFSPRSDSLSDGFTLERRIGRFRAYNFDQLGFNQQFSTDSRLIGRSVWNTQWILVIPGATFLADADEGLDRLVYGQDVADQVLAGVSVTDYPNCQTLQAAQPQAPPTNAPGGIKDILLFFRTYAYSGN